jgi:hypothetical protein
MAKAKPLSRREFSLAQNDRAMQSNIQNPKATSRVRDARHPSLASSLGWGVPPKRRPWLRDGLGARHSPPPFGMAHHAAAGGGRWDGLVNPRAQGLVGTSWCVAPADGSKTNKAGMFLRFRVIELVTARSIKDSNCAAPAADRAGVLDGVASS